MEFHAAGPWRSKWGLAFASLSLNFYCSVSTLLASVWLVVGHDS